MISKVKLKHSDSLKRKTTVASVAIVVGSLVQVTLPGGSASGQTLQSTQAEAAGIVARLNYLGTQVSILSEKYDQAQLNLTSISQKVQDTKNQISLTELKIKDLKAELSREAINVYVSGGNLPAASALLSENPTQVSIRQEYINMVTNSQADIVATFKAANQNLNQQQALLKRIQQQAATDFKQVSAARNAAQAAVTQEQTQLDSINSNIRALVVQQQQIAATQAAARSRSIINSGSAGSVIPVSNSPSLPTSNPTVNGNQVQIALAWARQELGKPYVFGGAGPNSFDCSGLTAFVYGKAGIYLPHSAAAQYNDTRRVPLSNLQPGDLVFYYSPISHVAIYIGGGEVLQALNPSAPVEISGLYYAGAPVGAGQVS